MGRKAKAGKLPKRIGGVKLPKDVRKGAARLIEAAASPAGRELLAGALAMAAGAIRAQARRQRADAAPPTAKATPHAGPVAPAAPPTPSAPPRAANSADPHDIGVELGRIAEAALQGLFGRKR